MLSQKPSEKKSLGKKLKIKTAVKKSVCMEMILNPRSYKTKPTINITKALRSEAGELKKSRYKSKKEPMMIKESTL